MDQREIRFPCDDGFSMRGILTLPDRQEPGPGLLLIYEVFGLNEEMKRVAREFAEAGYVVLIPDLFHRGPKLLCVARAIRSIVKQSGRPLDDLDAARRYLASRPEVDAKRLGVVGFCMGGGFAIVLAMRGHYKVAAPFYGEVPEDLPSACPTVASFGGLDEPLRDAPVRLRRSLDKLGVPADIKVYEDAGHSFYTRIEGPILQKIGPLLPMHAGYHEPSALDAKDRVLAFFQKHLDPVV
ncbi:dienelactone hydrolase family protein [Polyangium jinanense]|uniref:Dienelactone hydrolase family protein n=1 Tax=Polyangium jinanense TaxID=2829994 RepID=A0A9X4ART4_9BACT|nr:dienelactone hydrolase family protein [Polyangium jinanense]MDC3952786.1 dienelactone hydrolase family protein [Polyangium jinanense]MDC3980405.1 dienelactone hydrolase family protein [Polyangium jinanense]